MKYRNERSECVAAKERKKSVKIGSQNDREMVGQRRNDITEQRIQNASLS